MRIGELIRSYYIFLIEHLSERVPNPWGHIYALLDVPPERHAIFDGFDARMDRAYALATELSLPEADIFRRIKDDGTALLTSQQTADPRLPILITYLQHVLTFSDRPRTAQDFAASLPTYVRQQHKQCVQCSLPLPTQKWGSGNVRSDIKVQMFSNRLGGGPREPVKRVCDICMMQFLVEKLNYREIRGEQPIYLHLFPYSFLTAPFLNGLRSTIRQITHTDVLAGALRVADVSTAMIEIVRKRSPDLKFTTRTKADKPQPFGLYLPRYSDTLGGVMTFPLLGSDRNGLNDSFGPTSGDGYGYKNQRSTNGQRSDAMATIWHKISLRMCRGGSRAKAGMLSTWVNSSSRIFQNC